jgi:hypothetical protein
MAKSMDDLLRDMYHEAWVVACGGAVNPVAMAELLARLSRTLMHRYGSTAVVYDNPAFRVVVGQLAYMARIAPGADVDDYLKLNELVG